MVMRDHKDDHVMAGDQAFLSTRITPAERDHGEGERRSTAQAFNLVQRCVRTQFNTQHQAVRRLIASGVNWRKVVQQAGYHRVQPLLLRGLEPVLEHVPSQVYEHLHRFTVLTAANNLAYLRELKRFLEVMERRHIRIIPFKGIILAEAAYGDLSLRPCGDIDIIVPQKQLMTVADGLGELGYRAHGKYGDQLRKGFSTVLYLSQQMPFICDDGFGVDVHIGIMPPGYKLPFNFNTLWERSQVLDLEGIKVRCFSPEDTLLVLCYHGIKNRWERLKHYCDIGEHLRAHEGLDWSYVLESVGRVHGQGVLYTALYMVHELLDVSLPDEVKVRVLSHPRATEIGDWLLSSLPYRVDRAMMTPDERFKLHLSVQDSTVNKLRYLTYSLLRRLSGG